MAPSVPAGLSANGSHPSGVIVSVFFLAGAGLDAALRLRLDEIVSLLPIGRSAPRGWLVPVFSERSATRNLRCMRAPCRPLPPRRAMRCSFIRRSAARPNERSSNMRHADECRRNCLGEHCRGQANSSFPLQSATACANSTIENEPRSVISNSSWSAGRGVCSVFEWSVNAGLSCL